MVRRILLPLTALLVLLVAAGPASATTQDSANRPASGVRALEQEVTVTPATGAEDSRAVSGLCNQPCFPACLFQMPYPCWEIGQSQYLTANSTEDMGTSCISGRQLLGAAQYDWGHIWGDYRGGAFGVKLWQNFHLAAGWYGMQSCLDPHNGGYYTQTTTLWPDNPAHHPISIRQEVHIVASQSYYWGAYLDPLI